MLWRTLRILIKSRDADVVIKACASVSLVTNFLNSVQDMAVTGVFEVLIQELQITVDSKVQEKLSECLLPLALNGLFYIK